MELPKWFEKLYTDTPPRLGEDGIPWAPPGLGLLVSDLYFIRSHHIDWSRCRDLFLVELLGRLAPYDPHIGIVRQLLLDRLSGDHIKWPKWQPYGCPIKEAMINLNRISGHLEPNPRRSQRYALSAASYAASAACADSTSKSAAVSLSAQRAVAAACGFERHLDRWLAAAQQERRQQMTDLRAALTAASSARTTPDTQTK